MYEARNFIFGYRIVIFVKWNEILIELNGIKKKLLKIEFVSNYKANTYNLLDS